MTDLISLRSREGDFGRIDFRVQTEGLLPGEQPLDKIGIFIPPGEYTFERWGSFIRSANHRNWSFQFRIDDGGYFNGDRFHVRPEIEWKPNEHFSISLRYDYNQYDFPGQQSATTRQITIDNEISFNARWSLVTLAQYDNVSEDVGINSRLRLNLSAGQDVWFVINHNMLRDPLTDSFSSTQTVAAAKIRYTFRY